MTVPAPTFPVSPADIVAAHERITAHVRRTPVLDVDAATLGVPVALKLELLQHTGSFKPRGAFNRALTADVPAAGLIAASGGNHGLAVAHVATRLGLRAEIFVPEASPAVKVDRLRSFGPHVAVTVTGALYADAHEASMRRAAETGALVVHPYDQPEVLAGQGTTARELDEQVPGIDTVLVAVGGGGLAAGVACWFAGRVRVVAVEPERSCALAAAMAAGGPVDVDVSGVASDSLGARRVGELAYAAAVAGIDRVVTVADADIVATQRRLWDEVRLVVEAGGAAAAAAVLSGAYVPEPDERVAVVVCGANTDPASVAKG
ncbi:MAG TPA: threonine/serine dehydratase [Acidimicrobiales bacterium]|nr:threonine/serine dehydratase [Acidimicrobiales bacterium]